MKRSEIIKMAQKLIMQGNIDPLWTTTEWSIFFDEAVAIVHEALVDMETGYFVVKDYRIEPDENGNYPLPDNFYSMIYARDSHGTLEHLTEEEEHVYGTTGYILVDNFLQIRNYTGSLPPIWIDYYKFPKEMPEWNGSDDISNTEFTSVEDFTPDPPLHNARGARVLARIIQYIAQGKDGTLNEQVSNQINGVLDRFTYRMYERQRK